VQMSVDEVPWLGSGKPDKRRLREIVEARGADPAMA
jgi:hypothetical protein